MLAIAALVLEGVFGYINPDYSFLLLDIKNLSPINWFVIILVLASLAAIYIIIEIITRILRKKGDGKND